MKVSHRYNIKEFDFKRNIITFSFLFNSSNFEYPIEIYRNLFSRFESSEVFKALSYFFRYYLKIFSITLDSISIKKDAEMPKRVSFYNGQNYFYDNDWSMCGCYLNFFPQDLAGHRQIWICEEKIKKVVSDFIINVEKVPEAIKDSGCFKSIYQDFLEVVIAHEFGHLFFDNVGLRKFGYTDEEKERQANAFCSLITLGNYNHIIQYMCDSAGGIYKDPLLYTEKTSKEFLEKFESFLVGE